MSGQPGLILYLEDMAALEMLPDFQFKVFLCGLYHYVHEGVEPAFNDITLDALFVLFRAKIDRDAAKYSRQIEQRRTAGRASAEKRRTTVNDRLKSFNETERNEQTESESETKSETEAEAETSLSHPSLSEVAAEAQRAGLQVDAAQFLADCEADGWLDSRGKPVRDWRKWLRGYAALKHAGAKTPPPAPSYDQRDYCPEELAARTDADFEAAVTALEGGNES